MSDTSLQVDISSADDVISRILPDAGDRLIALSQLVASAEHAEIVAPNAWGVTLYADMFRLNVGRVEVFVVTEGSIRLNCMGRLGEEPFVGPHFESTNYRSVPDPNCAFVGEAVAFAKIAPALQAEHVKFIDVVGRTKDGQPVAGSKVTKSHSAELIAYAREVLASQKRKESGQAPWMSEDEASPEEVFIEGARITVQVNAFERNTAARDQCLEYYGRTCFICKFNSEAVYGEGIKVMHVHHIQPLSKVGKSYRVDPIKHLRPVCPNCHAVIHSRPDALTLEEVCDLLFSKRNRG